MFAQLPPLLTRCRFWWLDLNTWVMEYSYSLQDHIFGQLDSIAYRDINSHNPSKMGPPPTNVLLDQHSPSPSYNPSPINLLLSQDCRGFDLGSFFIRRSQWSERLLDVWFDPVVYEQKHREWEHNEQDALEYLYEKHPWIRDHVAFLPQRYINSFPPGACGDGNDPAVHYQEEDHDFVVNMAGCQIGRDWLGEMYQFREYSDRSNHMPQKRCMDKVKEFFRKMFIPHGNNQRQAVVAPWPST